jgi:hypothetical protein
LQALIKQCTRINRRDFIKKTGMGASMISIAALKKIPGIMHTNSIILAGLEYPAPFIPGSYYLQNITINFIL